MHWRPASVYVISFQSLFITWYTTRIMLGTSYRGFRPIRERPRPNHTNPKRSILCDKPHFHSAVGYGRVAEVRDAVLYKKPHTITAPDYTWRTTDKWINFPWSVQGPIVGG